MLKNNKNIKLIFVFIIIFIFTFSGYFFYAESSKKFQSLSSENNISFSYLKEVLKQSGVNVSEKSVSLKSLKKDIVYILYSDSIQKEEELNSLKNFTETGGRLVIIEGDNPYRFSSEKLAEDFANPLGSDYINSALAENMNTSQINDYVYLCENAENGKVLFCRNWEEICNDALSSMSNYSQEKDSLNKFYEFYTVLYNTADGDSVIFNTRYLGNRQYSSMYEAMPENILFAVINILMIIVFIFLIKSSYHGRLEKNYDVEERSENEFIYTRANVYYKAQSYEIIRNDIKKELDEKFSRKFVTDKTLPEVLKENNSEWADEAKIIYDALCSKEKITARNKDKYIKIFLRAQDLIKYINT